MVRPMTTDSSLAAGYQAIWAGQPGKAEQPILLALSLDPGSPERWADMAEAFHADGRDDDARYCAAREVARAPGLPHVAMRAAGMYFRLNAPVTALQLTNRVVGETREYDGNVFQTWQRLGGTAADVFRWGVGSNTIAGRGYFRFLLDAGDRSATDAAWAALGKKGMAGVTESRFYAESLERAHAYEVAAAIESGLSTEGVWNGGFESDWTGRGLDWLVESGTGVEVSRDTGVRHGGGASLRLEFDGTNRDEFSGISQVRVLPGGHWKLQAMVRTELKATAADPHVAASGIGMRVRDEQTGRELAETASVSGAREWTPIAVSVDAGSHARPVRIEILRRAAAPSELAMSGAAWVDDVTLTREGSR